MIDVKFLREDPEQVKKDIASKNVSPKIVDEFTALDGTWRELTPKLDEARAEQKKLSDARKIEEAKKNKEVIRALEEKVAEIEKERMRAWRQIPNPPLPGVIRGTSEKDNKVVREVGEKPKFSFAPKDYLTLAENLGLVDMERAAKTSGSRFGYLLGPAVRLEFALGQLVFETLADTTLIAGIIKKEKLEVRDTPFVPVIPPVLLNEKSMAGMGYLDRGADEIYFLPKDNLYLAGTSEQAIGAMHQDEIFEAKDLPRRYVGFSACFRREAGSYGKDTKGILRVHQFDKLEMFSFAHPDTSRDEHKLLLALEEHLMQALKLPYHVLDICSADLGDPAAAKYDIEAWMPGQNGGKGEYRETHSTSNTTDFQARRLNIRYRSGKETAFLHMLNGTAFAVGRMLIAIFENYQTQDGKIKIPEALQKYAGAEIIG